jgi:hypothetical protein
MPGSNGQRKPGTTNASSRLSTGRSPYNSDWTPPLEDTRTRSNGSQPRGEPTRWCLQRHCYDKSHNARVITGSAAVHRIRLKFSCRTKHPRARAGILNELVRWLDAALFFGCCSSVRRRRRALWHCPSEGQVRTARIATRLV